MPVLRVSAIVLVVLAACAKGSSGPTPPPPTDLRVTEPQFGFLIVTWTPPAAAVDGYEVEARVESGAFARIHDGLVPADYDGGTVQLDPSIPELVHLGFRIRSVHAGVAGDWSPEAVHLHGIRPPPALAATLVAGPAIALAWTNASLVADAVLVERADADGYGNATGPWTALPVAFGATTLTDVAPRELVRNAYRVRYGKGDVWSTPTAASAGPVPLFAPAGFTATVTAEGVRLSWTNRSLVATALAVRRWPDGTTGIAALPPDATSWVDARLPAWPSSRYAVVATAASGGTGGSGGGLAQSSEAIWAGVAPFQAAGPDGPLDARAAPAPDAIAVGRTGAGAFAWLEPAADGSVSVAREVPDGVERHALSFRQLVRPYLAVDGAGRPHAFGYDLPVSGPIPTTHEWLSDTGWTREMLPEPPGLGSATQWGIDAAGALQLLSGGQLCVPASGAWSCAAVPDPSGPGRSLAWSLDVSRDGTALLATSWARADGTVAMAIATRPPGGAFTVEETPFDCGLDPGPRIVPDAGGDLGLLCEESDPANPPGEASIRYAERRGGGWSAPEETGATTVLGVLGGAATPGLARVHAFVAPGAIPPTRLELWSRAADGTWTGAPVAPSLASTPLVGHLDSGEAWLVARPADPDSGAPVAPAPFSLWQEP